MALLLQTPEVEKSGLYDNLAEGYDFVFVVLNFRAKTSKAVLLAEAKQVEDKIFNRLMQAVTESDGVYGMREGSSEVEFGPTSDEIYEIGSASGRVSGGQYV